MPHEMRWFRRWLRSVVVLLLTVPLFLFALLTIIGNNLKDNYIEDKTFYDFKQKFIGNVLNEKSFEPLFHLRRNSTGLPISEWRSSVKYNQLLDINDFDFVRNCSHLCDKTTQPFLVTVVHSSPKNFLKREVIRKTWGSLKTVNGFNVITVFIVGLVNDSTVDRLLHKEYLTHRDLVFAKFVDSYQNLTYKHLTTYKWVLRFCNKTKFIMKSDDDSFIDIFRALKVLSETFYSELHNQNPRNIIACSLFPEGTPPKREGKWSLSLKQYPYRTYPAYCSGVAYFLTPDVAFDLLEAAHKIKPVLPIDDVFVTGIVASYLNILHFPLNLKYVYDDKRLREWLYDSNMRPNSYMIADIGDVSDWQSLMTRLWIKTVRTWS